MTEKSQQITFTKGITNQPSDAICSDGELSNCVGLTAEYGELKPIQMPVVISGTPRNSKILCIHDGRYIYEYSGALYYNQTDNNHKVMSFNGNLKDVTTIGNTVVASTAQEMHYALWGGGAYKDLGTKIPEPDVSFYIGEYETESVRLTLDGSIDADANIVDEQAWTDNVVGSYDKVIKKIHQKRLFAEPFVARVAVELYDGSYIMHSNPFILLPLYSPKMVVEGIYNHLGYNNWSPYLYMKGYNLFLSGRGFDYSEWSDIVNNVSVFVSREVRLFNVSTDAKFDRLGPGDGLTLGYRLIAGRLEEQENWREDINLMTVEVLDAVPDSDVERKLKEESVFFKLCDIGNYWTGGPKRLSSVFSYDVLDNIEAQPQLSNEDYHSHDNHIGEQLYSYNGRLHISGIKRYFFGGFKSFFKWNRTSSITYHIKVKLSINGQDKYVSQTVTTNEAISDIYFYYPDPRAKEVTFYNGSTPIVTRQLTEHPGLNGAYWFAGFPDHTYITSNNGFAPNMTQDTIGPWIEYVSSETLVDTIMTSEVDNPWLFLSKGYVKVNAPVVGMAAVTMALSEYQHGHQPLVVFTEKGIWSLSLNEEGYYTSVQAVSREVCNNASSITQVDHGIYFVSQKGLMYLNTAGVKCVSDQMRGTEFDEFIDNCMIAYDYRDSLLHIYPNPNNAHGFGDTYVYNMKTGTFSTVQGSFTNVVNNYPDTLVQNSSYYAYSFMQRPDEQSDGSYSGGTFIFNTYNARIETRPMKLENALALKSILQARHIHTIKFSQTTTLKFKVYASNNLDRAQNTWVQLTSLRGRPWKYYKFVYEFTGLKATDRFAGTMLITQERRTDKLR